jgi:hypothetical protein
MRSVILLVTLAVWGCDGSAIRGPEAAPAGGKADGVTAGCAFPQMFLMGTPRNFGVAPGGPLAMTCNGGLWEVTEIFAGTGNVFGAGGLQFHSTGSWGTGQNWGDNRPTDGVADPFGEDIVIAQPGTYRITLDDRSFAYQLTRLPSSCDSVTMYARGSFNGWGTQDMFCVGANQWAAIVMFIGPAEQYKFDARGDWTQNYGDFQGDGIADPGGWNIAAPGAGRYLVTLDVASGRYAARLVSPACALPTMYVRATWNGWGTTAMECENGHYAINIDAGGGASFKFDARGDWSLNWGDNNGDLQGDQNGANINVVGQHHLHFYNDARYAYDTHQ